ncbi:hypothetical protein [Pseudomonas veronii]|uniref:hypothetical protein n=1 Tax=Pseudomonas veronii TaxID=76761 RepID=UPI00206EC7B0|nr:hypothetical protein [uncultured Pseudomonas sp.]DAM47902.1 MAG TPA: hypothetical protein [Caudoviricetes sp.]
MSDFQTETMPVARKQHKCCECYGPIQPGQQYQLITGCWEGDMATFKTCALCLAARSWATGQPEWGGDDEHLYYFGQLEEDLSYLAPEIRSGDGRRFKAYRFQLQITRRRMAASEARKAA